MIGRSAVRMHDAVRHVRHHGVGIVSELVGGSRGSALVTWPREQYTQCWIGAEALDVVKHRTPSIASKRRLLAKIAKAGKK